MFLIRLHVSYRFNLQIVIAQGVKLKSKRKLQSCSSSWSVWFHK
jgi:hypothetical protein